MSISQYNDLKNRKRVAARYIEQEICEDNENKLIMALPPVRTVEECYDDFINEPAIRKFDGMTKEQKVLAMKNTLNKLHFGNLHHPRLDMEFATLLLESYRNKRMYDISKVSRYYDSFKQESNYIYLAQKEEEMNGFTVCGVSGGGKTTIINEVLEHIPQVIYHEGGDFAQLTYIKVNCPANRSFGAFYDSCVMEMEKALERKLIPPVKKPRNVREREVFFKMQANRFALGILVIDEIQNLALDKTMSLNQILELSNEINCPIVLVGTYKAINLIENKNFCVLRRAGMRIMVDPLPNDDLWENTIDILWKYQWVSNPVQLTEEIRSCLHEHTGGIYSCLINLYKEIQKKCILYEEEKITVELIEKIVDESFPYLKNIATKLKTVEGQNLWDDMYCNRLKDIMTTDKDMIDKIAENRISNKKINAIAMEALELKNKVVNAVDISVGELCDFDKIEEMYNSFHGNNIGEFRSISENKKIQALVKYIFNTLNSQEMNIEKRDTGNIKGSKKGHPRMEHPKIELPRLDQKVRI